MAGDADGLRVVFDLALDGGGWPGALGGREAVAGEAWLGPLGLVGRLETELGLGGMWATAIERAAQLAKRLAAIDGFWSRSFEADALGTCKRLLADRDLLYEWGWRGEAGSDRLVALWRATVDALPGLCDRLSGITTALDGRAIDIAAIEMHTPRSVLSPLWRQLFAGLAKAGVKIREVTTEAVRAPGDLGSAKQALSGKKKRFAPLGDGRLALLRAHGPLAAADEVAASLAAMDSLEGVVVIGGDGVLDAALARHGLPRLGGPCAAPGSAALVRLVIEAAFRPMDPAELHALVCMDPGPVPRSVARRLVGALGRFPGRGSTEWQKAWAEGVAACEEDRRASIDERLQALLMPAAERSAQVAASEIARRLLALSSWARGRVEHAPSLWAVVQSADALRALIAALDRPELSRVELRRLSDEVTVSAAPVGEAGMACVSEPGQVLGPAEVIVWWGFTRDRAPAAPRLRLSRAERAALEEAGVTAPDLGLAMETAAAMWRRPLDMASQALVLVCPRTDEAGEAAFAHPLWDELSAAMSTSADALEVARLAVPAVAGRRQVALSALPSPTPQARAPGPVSLRDVESPSSLERLLGCSLSWALHYRGYVRGGLADGPGAPSPLLYGQFAHHLLAKVFEGGALDGQSAEARAEEIFDGQLLDLCESLCLPRYQVEQTALRQAIVGSARELGEMLATESAKVRGVELEAKGNLGGIEVCGYADFVLSSPPVVLDFKWGITTYRNKLECGSALQLATYAELFADGTERPQVGYFVLTRQELIGDKALTLPRATQVGTQTAQDTWRGAQVALSRRTAELGRGELFAPAADGGEVDEALTGDGLTVAPACKYCQLDAMCGRGGCQ